MNLSLCSIIADNCSMDKMTCCCKGSGQKTSASEKLEKKCCCEIKEMTNHPAEIILSLNESVSKNLSVIPALQSGIIFNNDFHIFNFRALSFHSPPKEINLLNSNFRI